MSVSRVSSIAGKEVHISFIFNFFILSCSFLNYACTSYSHESSVLYYCFTYTYVLFPYPNDTSISYMYYWMCVHCNVLQDLHFKLVHRRYCIQED